MSKKYEASERKLRSLASPHEVRVEWEFAGKHAAPADKPIVEALWTKPRKWRFDYAIPALRIAWEIDGAVWISGRHNRGGGYLGDTEKLNTATALGWRVIRSGNSKDAQAKALQFLAMLLEQKQ